MANKTEAYKKLIKENIVGNEHGVCVIFKDIEGYGHVNVQRDLDKLEMLKTLVESFEAGHEVKIVVINDRGEQVYPSQGQKGATMTAQSDKNGFIHVNDGDKKDVYFVITLDDRYRSFEGAETVEALATKMQQLHDSPARLVRPPKNFYTSELRENKATGRYEQVQGPHFYPGPVPVESAKEKEA